MKILKNSLLLLLLVFLLDSIMTYAASVVTINVSYQIPRGEVVTTNYRTKPSDSFGPQTYTNNFTNTDLTSPCPNCVIAVKFESKDGDYTEQSVRMGNTIKCNLDALWVPGEYRLQLRRSDFTALTTYTSGEWKFYPQP